MLNQEEIWKDIQGYEGKYQVSSLGRVKSNYLIHGFGRILKGYVNMWGYHLVALYGNKKYQRFQVHRLVAECFIPNPENKPQVNHKDGNKKNNNLNNLEWMTSSENHFHAYRNNLCHPLLGSNHQNSKLIESDVLEIRSKYENGFNKKELAKQHGVSLRTIRLIIERKAWRHI